MADGAVVAKVNNYVLPLWLIAFGVVLVRGGRAGLRSPVPAVARTRPAGAVANGLRQAASRSR